MGMGGSVEELRKCLGSVLQRVPAWATIKSLGGVWFITFLISGIEFLTGDFMAVTI